jgi:hypothetical protein
MVIIALKFATLSEQHVDWGNQINYISMRDQNSPSSTNNMLSGVVTSTLIYLHKGSKFASPPSPPMNNMLIGVRTWTLSSYPPEVRRGATSGFNRVILLRPWPWPQRGFGARPWAWARGSRQIGLTVFAGIQWNQFVGIFKVWYVTCMIWWDILWD